MGFDAGRRALSLRSDPPTGRDRDRLRARRDACPSERACRRGARADRGRCQSKGRQKLMSRGAQSFKQGDVTRAIKAAVKSGVKGWRVEIAEGKIIVVAAEPASASGADH